MFPVKNDDIKILLENYRFHTPCHVIFDVTWTKNFLNHFNNKFYTPDMLLTNSWMNQSFQMLAQVFNL